MRVHAVMCVCILLPATCRHTWSQIDVTILKRALKWRFFCFFCTQFALFRNCSLICFFFLYFLRLLHFAVFCNFPIFSAFVFAIFSPCLFCFCCCSHLIKPSSSCERFARKFNFVEDKNRITYLLKL